MGYEKKLSPIVKWAGGKERELKYIIPNIPKGISRYIEPFIGGGAVYFSINNGEMIINDKSSELINFYLNIRNNNTEFIQKLLNLQSSWLKLEDILYKYYKDFEKIYYQYKKDLNKNSLKSSIQKFITTNKNEFTAILNKEQEKKSQVFEKELLRNICAKFIRMAQLEDKKGGLCDKDISDNFECALKSSFYMFIRTLYNENKFQNSEYFYFIREYCYSSMFRYNKKGQFNVPYGGISYNHKNLNRKINHIQSKELQIHLKNTKIYNLDFEDFLNKINLTENDFIFLDPPYDTDFNNYVNNSFDKEDQIRLANYLINKCRAKFMMIIKNSEFILNLYSNKKGLFINNFEKKYIVSFKNRNNKECNHLLITNYPITSKLNKKIAPFNHLR